MKAKVKLTIEKEYELNPEWYPPHFTAQQMLNTDIDGILDDPLALIDENNSNLKVEGELVNE